MEVLVYNLVYPVQQHIMLVAVAVDYLLQEHLVLVD
jgi:hypothetical protein